MIDPKRKDRAAWAECEWTKIARANGASEKDIQAYIDSEIRETEELEAGRCPKCGAPIVRYGGSETREMRVMVGLPAGPNLGPGEWVMYRCSRDAPPGVYDLKRPCGFCVDLYEASESN